MTQTSYCKRHSDVETNIACGRCGDSICARCLVHAPVGVRCPDCGRSRPAPTFDVSPIFLLRGVAAGIGAAIVGAAAAWLVIMLVPIFYVSALVIAALGIVVGESISLATNRKRGARLKFAAGSCVALSFLLLGLAPDVGLNLYHLFGAGAGIYLATTRL